MKVSGIGSGKGVDRSRKKERTQGADGDFAERLRGIAGAPSAVTGTDAAQPVQGIGSILAAQEVGDATDGPARRKARKHGDDLLDRLEGIRRGLLAGAIAKDDLAQLAQRIRAGRQRVVDPRLNAILDEIELRCEVEIAKLTRQD